jgi:hypothetical protein
MFIILPAPATEMTVNRAPASRSNIPPLLMRHLAGGAQRTMKMVGASAALFRLVRV